MQTLSEDDRNLTEMTDQELALAWDLWFDLAQSTNDYDPPYSHGVFAGTAHLPALPPGETASKDGKRPELRRLHSP